MAEEKFASFNPDEATVQGLFDEGDFEIVNPRIDFFQYQNSSDKGVGLLCDLKGADVTYENNFWSAGGTDKVAPSGNNERILFVGTTNTLNVKSNFVKLMASLKNVGVPVSLLDGSSIKKIAGLKLHLVRQPNPDAQKNAKGEQPKVLVATKLISLPGEKKGASTTTATATATESAAPAGGEMTDKAVNYVLKVISAKGGKVARKEISGEVFRAAQAAKDGDALKLSKLVFDEKFLKGNSGNPVEYDGSVAAFEYDEAAKEIKIAA